MRYIIGLFLILILISCQGTEKKDWKYSGGYYVGDWLSFDTENIRVVNDTIWVKDSLAGKVILLEKRLTNYWLTVQAIDDTTRGFYCSK